MNIAIIGTGNVGGALAGQWSKAGHRIHLGVKDTDNFKGKALLSNANTMAYSIPDAVAHSEVIVLAIPPFAIFEILEQLDDMQHKIIIDATNAMGKLPSPYGSVFACVADKTKAEVVKCFNTTGFENIMNPMYDGTPIDMFMAGDSSRAKEVAGTLAIDAGFGSCIDFGKSDKVELLEKFAMSWINLAIIQGHGRNMAFRLVTR